MNFFPAKGVATSCALATVLALGFSPASQAAQSTHQLRENLKVTQSALPSVTAHAGVAPVIGKPVGTAPKALVKKDIFVGKGKVALSSSTVRAQYVLMSWKTGKVLQSSWPTGFSAPLSGVIPGWQQGIPGMKVGGRRLLVIPPALAYGAAGGGPVGPNETLIFVVDLLGVK